MESSLVFEIYTKYKDSSLKDPILIIHRYIHYYDLYNKLSYQIYNLLKE